MSAWGGSSTDTQENEDFKAWQAERDAKRAAEQEARDEAARVRADETQAQKARRAEDGAECPACGAERNNPSRAGHPQQEYLTHCWRCGYGSVSTQEYPVVAEA